MEKKRVDRTIIKLFISHGCCWLTLRLDTLNVKQAGAFTSLAAVSCLSLAVSSDPVLVASLIFLTNISS